MDWGTLTNLFTHADALLSQWMEVFGAWVYLILFLIVFLETNIVVGPPLPGDTLAIACGALTATGHLDGWLVLAVNLAATLSGYFVNYWLGEWVRRSWVKDAHPGFMQRPVIKKAERFFREHAEMSILFARFIPFMRSIAPFVAGMGQMPFRPFAIYSTVGGFLWTFIYFFMGYFVTDVTVLSGHLWMTPLCIALLFLPAWLVSRYFQMRRNRKAATDKAV